MQKYLNNIIFILGTILLINQPIGLSLLIPVTLYLKRQSLKNYIIIIILVLISILLNHNKLLIQTIITFGVLSIYSIIMFNKKNSKFDYILTFILALYINISINLKTNNYIYVIVMSLTSVLVLFFFYYNQDAITKTVNFNCYYYNELMLAIISIFGFAGLYLYETNLGLLIACYFAMYFSTLKQYKKCIFLAIATIVILQYIYVVEYSYLVLIIAGFYLFPKMIALLVLMIFAGYFSFVNKTIYPINLMEMLICVGLVFTILAVTFIVDETEGIVQNIYENINQKLNNATLSFSSFLDSLGQTYNESALTAKQAEIFQNMYQNHCQSCHFRNDCIQSKGRLYHYYKEMLYERPISDAFCPNYIEMKRSMYNLKNKYDFDKLVPNNTFQNLANGLSGVLRQYTIDKSRALEYDYQVFINIKKALLAYGFSLTLYEIRKTFSEDFLIEIGIINYHNSNKEIIEKIVEKHINTEASAIFKDKKGNKTYLNIVPKINFEVEYGYGSLASIGSNVCGDNYLIKQLDDSKVIAAISDGMGHGIKANIESIKTLEMINNITNMDLTTDAALQIVNTLLYIQDYEDMYATLDFIQIDRKNGEALIYKAGATTTYLFHADGTFKKIINENLPFGIEELIDIKKYKIENGDLIILASDGVFENVLDNNDLENHMAKIINNDPQQIIYDLLNYMRYSKVKTKDDMSIVALKIIKS